MTKNQAFWKWLTERLRPFKIYAPLTKEEAERELLEYTLSPESPLSDAEIDSIVEKVTGKGKGREES